MHTRNRLLSALFLALLASSNGLAQQTSVTPPPATDSSGATQAPAPTVSFTAQAAPVIPPQLQAMLTAQNTRIGIVTSIASGAITPEVGLLRLKAEATPFGLGIDADAEQAFAAAEIGQRLLSLGKSDEAVKYFQYAELSLTKVIGRTADTKMQDKAQYLSKRASIRAEFLNKGKHKTSCLDS